MPQIRLSARGWYSGTGLLRSLLSVMPQKFPVFYTSLLRVFAITQIAKEKNINEFVHFDNDVIVYKSFEEIVRNYKFDYKTLNITQNKSSEVVFGYSLSL